VRLVAFLFSFGLIVSQQVRPIEGIVTEVRVAGATTFYHWDATPYVVHLVNDRIVGAAGLRALERTALLALADRAKTSRTSQLLLRVLYQKTGAVNPAYGTPAFAGVEVVLTMRAARANVAGHAAQWQAALLQGRVPSGLSIAVTGKLPPPR
jgi:hypothetical protein